MSTAVDLMYRIAAKDAASAVFDSVAKNARGSFEDVAKSAATAAGETGRHWWNGVGGDGPGSVAGGVGRATSGLKVMGGMAATAGVALGGLAFAKVAGEGMQMANMLETTKSGFTTMLGSAEAAEKFTRSMSDFAATTPFEFPELAQTSQMMMAMGFSAKEVLPTLTSVGDAVGALGGTGEQVQRVTRALGQMQAKGKVAGEEMMQLTEAGIPAWELLATKIGVSVPEAQEMVRKGQVDLNAAMDGLIDGMGEKYKGGMANQAKTIEGMMSTLRDNVGLALASIVEPFLPLIKRMIGGLSEFSGSAGAAIRDVMEKVGPVVGRLFDYFRDAATNILPKVKGWWDQVSGSFQSARPGLENLGRLFGGIAKVLIEDVVPVLVDLSGKVGTVLIGALGKLGEVLPTIGSAILTFVGGAVKAFGGLFDAVLAGVEHMIGFLSKIPGPWQDNMKQAAAAVEGFRDRTAEAMTGAIRTIDAGKVSLVELKAEADKEKVARLRVDHAQAMEDLRAAKASLRDPDLTAERKAEIRANIADLQQKVKDGKEALASVRDVEVDVKATLNLSKIKVHPGIAAKLERLATEGGMNEDYGTGTDPGSGLMAATAGRGSPGAGFGKWGPNWSWNRGKNGLGQHDGADISAGYGTRVYATRSGSIAYAGDTGNWAGKHVVWYGGGTRFTYAHLSGIARTSGSFSAGELLGWVGSTGNSTGPHLHVQARRGGALVNPSMYLAEGGIVRARPGGTLAVIGEGSHDEAVIPLRSGGAGLGGEMHVHFHGPIVGSREDLARYITQAQREYKRSLGTALGLS